MQDGEAPFTNWIKSDVKTANTISIMMIIFAAWAGIEAISNLAGVDIPPVTGMETNTDPDDTQRTNNGVIVGLGAVLGTVGIIIQLIIPRETDEEETVEQGPRFDEDLVKLTKWLCSRGTTTAQFFDWADVDNSGTIDMVELANALRQAEIANLPPWEIEELVKIMDINSDGRINLPELDIMLLKIQNTLGIDFIPYVEEETEAEDDSEEEEESTEEVDADSEDSDDEDSEEDAEESEDEATAEDESDSDDSDEEDAEEDAEEESEEGEDGDSEDGTDSDDSDEEDAEEETEDDSEESDDEVAEDETEAEEDDSTEEETEDEPVEEEPPKKKKKF